MKNILKEKYISYYSSQRTNIWIYKGLKLWKDENIIIFKHLSVF